MFRACFVPMSAVETLRSEYHILMYGYGGIDLEAAKRFTRREREWFVEQLKKQKEAEAKAGKSPSK